MSRLTLDTTILGGLPVTVDYAVVPEDRSVGLFGVGAEDFCICTRKGDPAPWAEKRMTKDDWDELEQECMDNIHSSEEARVAAWEDYQDGLREDKWLEEQEKAHEETKS